MDYYTILPLPEATSKFDEDSDSEPEIVTAPAEEDATTGKDEPSEVSANGKQNGVKVDEVEQNGVKVEQNGGKGEELAPEPAAAESNGKPSTDTKPDPAAAANGGEKELPPAGKEASPSPVPSVCEFPCYPPHYHLAAKLLMSLWVLVL